MRNGIICVVYVVVDVMSNRVLVDSKTLNFDTLLLRLFFSLSIMVSINNDIG